MQKIVNYLGSIVPSAENPELDVIYTALMQVIGEANSNVKARITRKENEKKDGEQK